MASKFILVSDEATNESYELPLEEDNSLLVSVLDSTFSGATGLKYRSPETGAWRVVKLLDGHILAPENEWGSTTYYAVFKKADVKRKAESDEENGVQTKHKKIDKRTSDLIVLGLSFNASEEDVKSHFEQFGELMLLQVKRDFRTGQPKGYGFIRFRDHPAQVKCLSTEHIIDGRKCFVRLSTNTRPHSAYGNPKIFISRLTPDVVDDDLRELFSQYGTITDLFLPKPFRGFAFVTFDDPAVAESLIGESFVLKSASIYVTTAEPKHAMMGKKGDYSGYPYPGGEMRSQAGIDEIHLQGASSGKGKDSMGMMNMFNPAMMAAYAQYCADQSLDGSRGGATYRTDHTGIDSHARSHDRVEYPSYRTASAYGNWESAESAWGKWNKK